MFPWNRLLWIAGILSIVFLSNAGCGQKRVHVATTSSTPGVEEDLSTGLGESTGLSAQSGLEDSNLMESGLSAGSESDESSTLPESEDSAVDQIPDVNDTADSQMTEELASMIPPQQEIQTNPSTQSIAPAIGESDSDDQLAFNGTPSPENANAMGEESEGSTPNPIDDVGTQNTDPAIERIPENIAVAKAEPSDAFQRQIEQMREEEVATVAAGVQDVFFEFDSWTITSEGKEALEHDADWLTKESSSLLLIEGHCDDRGTQAYNLVLGKKRAVAIRDYLVELGVDSSRLGFISYGKDKPFCSDPSEVCYQLNRRGRLVVQNP